MGSVVQVVDAAGDGVGESLELVMIGDVLVGVLVHVFSWKLMMKWWCQPGVV